jgi:hypothetical protein
MGPLLRVAPRYSPVPGIRFFACDRCDTVYADPGRPRWCDRCADARLVEITGDVQSAAYFAPGGD